MTGHTVDTIEQRYRARRLPGLLTICAVSAATATAYGILLPNLLDRDEASFFATVQWYAAHAWMPVLGHTGVSYEAQQGPGYYIPAAAIEWLFRPLGAETAFHAVRLLGVPLLVGIVILAYLLAARLCPDNRSVPLLTAALVGLNPHLLSLSGSVSNDLLGILLAMGAVYLFTTRLQGDTFGGWTAVAVGFLIGLSIDTKPSALSLVAALPLAALLVRSRSAVVPSLLMAAGVLAASGWWFVRNEIIYGDLTGIAGLRRWGWPVHAASLDTVRQIVDRASYFAVSYVSPQPTFGGSFRTPLIAKLVFALLAGAVVVGLARHGVTRGRGKIRVGRAAALTFALVLLTSIAANVFSYLTVLIVDPRTTFASFFVVAAAGALGLGELSARWRLRLSTTVVAAALLLADVATLHATSGIPRPPLVFTVALHAGPHGSHVEGPLLGADPPAADHEPVRCQSTSFPLGAVHSATARVAGCSRGHAGSLSTYRDGGFCRSAWNRTIEVRGRNHWIVYTPPTVLR